MEGHPQQAFPRLSPTYRQRRDRTPSPGRAETSMAPTQEQVTAALATVIDPEIRRPITDLGMVKGVDITPDGKVRVGVYLTVAGCPMKDTIRRDVTAAVSRLDGVSAVE